ncbi:MAG: hypothetical protein AABY22_10750 [Nanoarchaeota archaeon]
MNTTEQNILKEKNSVDKIELWKCKKQIAVPKSDYGKDEYQRKILIEVGEIVEFRYHANIHFRTEDNIYCVLDEDTFYKNFEPYGKIWDNVKFANRCELKDILEHNLYNKVSFEVVNDGE